jgi:hypothetical protein
MTEDSDKYFYFSDGARRFGPYSRQQVLDLLYQSRVGIMDQIFDSRTQEWTKLYSHGDFDVEETEKHMVTLGLTPEVRATNVSDVAELISAKLKSKPGAPPPLPAAGVPAAAAKIPEKAKEGTVSGGGLTKSIPQSPTETKSWFMKEGAITLGPYHYLTILAMIQDGTLRDNDLLKQKGEKDWKKVVEIFSKEEREQVGALIPLRIENIAPERANLRKDMRRDINRVLLVSDEKVQYVVQGLDISVGGIAFASLAPHFQVGQVLTCTLTHTTKDIVDVKGTVHRIQTIKSANNEIKLLKYVLIFDEKIDPSVIMVSED